MVPFIECESININYNVMGIATITYTWIADSDTRSFISNNITIGNVEFRGWITDVYQQPIANTEKADGGSWYSTNVTMVAVS